MDELAAAKKELARLEAETERLLKAQQAAYAEMARDKGRPPATLAGSRSRPSGSSRALIDKPRPRGARAAAASRRQYNGTLAWPMAGPDHPGVRLHRVLVGARATASATTSTAASTSSTPSTRRSTPSGAGKVIIAGRSPYDPAWIVVIAHSEHLVTWYGHVDNVKKPVVTGRPVRAKGQLIAYEGTTGYSTGPHLHWAVQLDGAWVNPRLFLPR